jgi:hypothetical protein
MADRVKVERLIGDKAMNNVISHHLAVQFGIRQTTEEIGAKAKGKLARHHDTGAAKIEVSYGDVDGFVSLVDEAAASIEFGHFVNNGEMTDEEHFVPGLYIITEAAGLLE